MLLHLRSLVTLAAVAPPPSRVASSQGVVRLSGGKAKLFKNGHPLIFSGAVRNVEWTEHKGGAGAVVDVVDGAGGLIGWGVWNPHSSYRVRMLAVEQERALLEHRDVRELLRTRLAAAAQRRAACCLPSDTTTAYRLVNSEGDLSLIHI